MKAIDAPTFSIVIPTYNRPSQLAACLQACTDLDYPRDRFEVLVIDDGGTTSLDDVVAPFRKVMALKLVRQENRGPAAARNRGASEAKGKFLAFTDDDCAPAAGWLRALEAQFALSPDCAVGGQTINSLTLNLYSTASQLLICYLLSYYNRVPDQARFFPSSNLAFPADRFHTIGGFNVAHGRAAGEDRELCDRWLRHGYRMIYVTKAVVFHAHDLTFRSFLRQHFNYGEGAFWFHKARANAQRLHIKPEPLSFYINMLSYPFVTEQGAKAPLLTFLFVATQIANAVGFFWKFTKETLK
jgi:GT2 family glycosyltransferase